MTNTVPVKAEISGAQDPESHSVFDSLCNNTTHSHSTGHATDPQGTNEGNFALLQLFG